MVGLTAKLMRECKRVGDRISDQLARFPEWRAQRARDRTFPSDLREAEGALSYAPKVAILLIWQPQSLADSVLETCRHLHENGYAPLIVSNAAISAADRARLLPLVWRLVERPNLGHDFGGYRDGVLLLKHLGLAPERLLVLNDSMWFPLTSQSDLIPRLEAAQGNDGFSGYAWMERPKRAHRAHYQSYFLMFGHRALSHPAFERFWREYPVSSRRTSVLKHGEKGLSRAMMAAGLCAPPLLSPALMLHFAEAADDVELYKILDYAALRDLDMRSERDRLLSGGAGNASREAILALISRSLMTGHFVETHPYLATRVLGAHLLKKRRDATGVEGRRQAMRAVSAGDVPKPQPVIWDEILRHDADLE